MQAKAWTWSAVGFGMSSNELPTKATWYWSGPKSRKISDSWRAASGCGKGNSETLWFKSKRGIH